MFCKKFAITTALFCFNSVLNFGNWIDPKLAKPKQLEMKPIFTTAPAALKNNSYFLVVKIGLKIIILLC